jgi:hypothetical protein
MQEISCKISNVARTSSPGEKSKESAMREMILRKGDRMPARDIFHYQAKHALERDGWVITHVAQRVMMRNQIRVVVFDVTQEVIVQWHE